MARSDLLLNLVKAGFNGRFDRTRKFREVSGSAVLVAPQGFEPRLIGSEPTVLPLNEGATD